MRKWKSDTFGTTLGLATAAAEPAGSRRAKSNRALLCLRQRSHTSSAWATVTYTSASGGRDLVALGTRAGEASLGVGAGSEGADLGLLGALVNI